MKCVVRILILGLLITVFGSMPYTSAAQKTEPLMRVRGTVWFIASQNLYAIMGDNGKKYHPIRKLPNAWMKDGLEVVVEGRIRDDLVGERLWGQPFEVVSITAADKYISWEDKEAINALLLRMSAFNTKNLSSLQAIDVVARRLSPEDFNNWLFDTGNYTLHYVETDFAINNTTINGLCLYSRQHMSSMALSGKTNYSVMNFTLSKIDGSWKFTDTSTYEPGEGIDINQVIDALLKQAQIKYGKTDLAKWKG